MATVTTFTFLAPNPYQAFAVGSSTYTADAYGLITGVPLSACNALVKSGCQNLGGGTLNDSAAWNANLAVPQVLAAFGATQGTAGQITSNRVRVTVTASTEGVKLKAVATGAETSIVVPGTVGVKVYPPSNGKLDALSTNTAVALVAGKGSIFLQISGTQYVTKVKGA